MAIGTAAPDPKRSFSVAHFIGILRLICPNPTMISGMARFSVQIDYGGQLWSSEEPETISWGDYSVHIGHGDILLSVEFELKPSQKKDLVSALADAHRPPHWSSLPVKQQNVVKEIEAKLRDGLVHADRHLRKTCSALRLPTAVFSHVERNSNQSRPVLHWSFDDKDKQDLSKLISELKVDVAQRVQNGMQLPLPSPFERRQVHITPSQISELRKRLLGDDLPNIPSSHSLLSVAWDDFEKHAFDSATIVLMASIETLIKWHISEVSSNLTKDLLENLPSPPLKKLVKLANEHTNLVLPNKFATWSQKLTEARNNCVHKSKHQVVTWYEFVRWYAMAEAIFRAIDGETIDDLVGEFVTLKSKNHPEINGLRGVVLRWETDYGDQSSFHVLLEDSTTTRAQISVVTKITMDKMKAT